MAGKTDPRLNYPAAPAVRASLGVAGEASRVAVIPAKPGERYDICLPANDPASANRMLVQMDQETKADAPSLSKQLGDGLLKSTGAGEFYLQQIKSAEQRFAKVARQVAADFAKNGKYTPENAATILEARRALLASLKDVYPGLSFYRVSPDLSTLQSSQATQRLAADVDAMQDLTGRPLRNLERNAVTRGLGQPTYLAEAPVQIDSKLAKRLGKVDSFMAVVDIAPGVAAMLTAPDERAQHQAAIELTAKTSGMLVDRLVTAKGMALCVGFGVATGGWGFIGCGIAVIGIGVYAGMKVEENMKALLPVIAPPPLP